MLTTIARHAQPPDIGPCLRRCQCQRFGKHQAFGAAGGRFGLGTAPARLELKILVEETVKHFPNMTISDEPTYVNSQFSRQLKTVPVALYR